MMHDRVDNPDNGHERGEDAGLDRFAASLKARLPRLSNDAMSRIGGAMQRELDAAYPPAAIPLRSRWAQWAATAAMLLVTLGLVWHVSRGPESAPKPSVAARITDEFRVVLKIDESGLPSGAQGNAAQAHNAWESLFDVLDRYAALIGIERTARR